LGVLLEWLEDILFAQVEIRSGDSVWSEGNGGYEDSKGEVVFDKVRYEGCEGSCTGDDEQGSGCGYL